MPIINIPSHVKYISAILIICAAAYLSSLHNEFLVDDHNFLGRKYDRHFSTVTDFFVNTQSQHYQPIYFLLNVGLFKTLGENPLPYRLINILLLMFCCISTYLLLAKVSEDKLTAFMATALFALHPFTANSVFQITHNVVFIFIVCMNLALIFLWLFAQQKTKPLWYLLSIGFFLLSALCLEVVLLFPVYALLLLLLINKSNFKDSLKLLAPFLILTGAYVLVWFNIAEPNAGLTHKWSMLGAGILEYISAYYELIAWYMTGIVFPTSVVLQYNVQPSANYPLILTATAILILICYIILFKKYALKRVCTFGLLWFLPGMILVLPAILTHAYMGASLQSHWLLYPSLGIYLIFGSLIVNLKRHLRRGAWMGLTASILLFLLLSTQRYSALARTEESFNAHWIEQNPTNVIALYRLGVINQNKGRVWEAARYYNKVLESNGYQESLTLNNLSIIYQSLGDLQKAKAYALQSLQADPGYALAYNSLGTIAINEADAALAIQYFKQALSLEPSFALALLNLGDAYLMSDQFENAIELFERSRKNSNLAEAKNEILVKLSISYFKSDRADKAWETIDEFLMGIVGTEEILAAAQLYSNLGLPLAAEQMAKLAYDRYENDVKVSYAYGRLLVLNGKPELALSVLEEALKQDQQNPLLIQTIDQLRSGPK